MWQYLVTGLAIGSLYSMLGLGLVLTFRSTNVLNFAQGEMAMLMAFVTFYMMVGAEAGIAASVIVTLVAGAALGAILYNCFIYPNRERDHEGLALISLGLKLAMVGLAAYYLGVGDRVFPDLFSTQSYDFAGLIVAPNQFWSIAIGVIVMALITLFLRYTNFGLAMRAAAENVRVAELLGVNPRLVGTVAWIAAAWLGGITGVLTAGAFFLSPYMMGHAVLKGFAALVVGGMTSVPGVMIAGLLIGVIEAVAAYFLDPVFQESVSLVLIILILILRPQGLLGTRETWRA
ncbi:MAG: branched-chain amino acid ABC transporter permease [Rhizobiaceae bacterium]|nr:branched-chain amino acid ABC transporter permease [Rhizobiaceae bacterium]